MSSFHEKSRIRMSEKKRIPKSGSNLKGDLIAQLFIIAIVAKITTDSIFIITSTSGAYHWIKDIILLMVCIVGLLTFVKKSNTKLIFTYEFKVLSSIFVLFASISLVQAVLENHFSVHVLFETSKLLIAPLVAFLILNHLNNHQIYRLMVIVLFLSWLGYLLELTLKGVSPLELLNADFQSSSSKTESSAYSSIAIALCFFFAYDKRCYSLSFLALLLNVLTFKRAAILFGVLVFALGFLFPSFKNLRVEKNKALFVGVIFFLAALCWMWMISPEQDELFYSIFGRSANYFTMGRAWIFNYLSDGFESYGFKSGSELALNLFGAELEMDCGEIFIEFGAIVLFAYCCLFCLVGKKSSWGLLVIVYVMFNCVFSRILTSHFALIVFYLVIGVASGDAQNRGSFPYGLSTARKVKQIKC